MRTTTSRLFSALAPVYNAASSPSCATSSKSSAAAASLPPIRYHVFRNPLPYPIGLRVQNELIEYRLARKAEGGGKNDIVLLLGKSRFVLVSCRVQHIARN